MVMLICARTVLSGCTVQIPIRWAADTALHITVTKSRPVGVRYLRFTLVHGLVSLELERARGLVQV